MSARKRQRIDVLLVERGLCESRTRAQALVMAGAVVVGEARVDKAGALVDPTLPIRLKEDAAPRRWVSRGAEKLLGALRALPIDPRGKVCADLGASTGGFTDVLLQHGAARVYAVDVGYGQLHPRLRADPRVVVRERENARALTAAALGERVDLVTGDLSFISLRLVLPAIKAILKAGGHALLLVKPQFEVGKGEVGKGGVVRDTQVHAEVLRSIWQSALDLALNPMDLIRSPIEGPAGNVEFLIWLRTQAAAPLQPFDALIPQVITA